MPLGPPYCSFSKAISRAPTSSFKLPNCAKGVPAGINLASFEDIPHKGYKTNLILYCFIY